MNLEVKYMTTITENQQTKDEAEICQLTARWLSIFSPKLKTAMN
jgi:hypothetical protein